MYWIQSYLPTKDFRISLEEEYPLFLAYLGNGRTSAKSIQPKTASRWLEGIMQDSGINTNKIKAHSLRSATSTKAVSLGVPIEQIKLHANWSLTSNTFEDYYYRPRNQHKRGSDIVNTVFREVTKNITTSEVGVEATAIVVGTTHNKMDKVQNFFDLVRKLSKNIVVAEWKF